MAEKTNQENFGKVLLEWKFPEVPQYSRSRRWYVGIVLAGLALLGWCVYDRNFLFAVIVVLFVIIVFYQARQKPRILKMQIAEEGLIIGKDYFSYDDIKKFWIIYQPPLVKTLYISFKSAVRPILGIALEDTDPVKVRKQLVRFIEEDLDQEDEPAADAYGRLFKI